MNLLKESGVHLLVANVVFYPPYEKLFTPFVDIALSSDHSMRFIGYTLPYRQEKELLKFNHNGPKVIDTFKKIHLKPFLSASNNNDRVTAVALSLHLGIGKVQDLISQTEPELKKKLSVVFAGHDHQQELLKTKSIYLIDSKAHFNFSQVLLDSTGKVLSSHFFNELSQERLMADLKKDSLEAELIEETEKFLALPKKKIQKIEFIKVETKIPKKERLEPFRISISDKKPNCIKVFKGKRQPLVYQR